MTDSAADVVVMTKTRMVYFIRGGADGPIKIGSSTDPEGRLATLQTTHWAKLELVGVCSGGFPREYALHEELRDHCLRGEWFAPTTRVLITMATCLVEDPEALEKVWTRTALDEMSQKGWEAAGFKNEREFHLWYLDQWEKSEPGSYGPSDDPAMNGETVTQWMTECLTVTGSHADVLTMRDVMDHMHTWATAHEVMEPWGELSKSKRRYRIQRRLAEVGVAWSQRDKGFVGCTLAEQQVNHQ